jgi:hypothetical protein
MHLGITLKKDNGFPDYGYLIPHNSSKVVIPSVFLQGFQPMTLFSDKKSPKESCPLHRLNDILLNNNLENPRSQQ